MALGAKMENRDFRVYTLLGDGEIEEGQVWEAAMFAGFRKLDNLCVMVDNNNLQIDGPIDQVCSPYPIDKKFEAFNFHVINADAHDFDAIRAAFKEARETKGMPTCIVFHSLKGKGVSFMENSVDWHWQGSPTMRSMQWQWQTLIRSKRIRKQVSSNGREYREKKSQPEKSYGNSLKELAEEFPNLVVLDADLAAATKTESSVRHIPTATSTAVSQSPT